MPPLCHNYATTNATIVTCSQPPFLSRDKFLDLTQWVCEQVSSTVNLSPPRTVNSGCHGRLSDGVTDFQMGHHNILLVSQFSSGPPTMFGLNSWIQIVVSLNLQRCRDQLWTLELCTENVKTQKQRTINYVCQWVFVSSLPAQKYQGCIGTSV